MWGELPPPSHVLAITLPGEELVEKENESEKRMCSWDISTQHPISTSALPEEK